MDQYNINVVFRITNKYYHKTNKGKIMSEDYKMTKKDKLVLGLTLAAIFSGVFLAGFAGLIINIFG